MNGLEIPEIDVHELARRLESDRDFVLLDVREPWELERARISDNRVRIAPVSQLARAGVTELPTEVQLQQSEILVLCHHGVRSAQVTGWLRAQGWTRVFNVRGGIDDYARQVDPGVGMYQ